MYMCITAINIILNISEKHHINTLIIVIINGGNKNKYQSPRLQIIYITAKNSHTSHIKIKAIINYYHSQAFSFSKKLLKYSGNSVSTVIVCLSLGCSKLI